MRVLERQAEMKKTLIFLFILMVLGSGADAGFFGNSVSFDDLAQVSSQGLRTLKESEFEVFLAEVKLAGVRAALKKSEGELKIAKNTFAAEKSDLKAVEAEIKAAKENQDEDRLRTAESSHPSARKNFEIAELLVNWKKSIVKTQKAAKKRAEVELDIAELKRDLARVSLMVSEKVPSAEKYSVDGYEKSLQKKTKELNKSIRSEERMMWEAEKLKADYERSASNK